jgi:hypothetical protein
MPAVGFKPEISAGEQPQNDAFHSAVTGTGVSTTLDNINSYNHILPFKNENYMCYIRTQSVPRSEHCPLRL